MANARLRDRAASPASLALLIGGGLLLASVVITVIAQPPLFPYAEMVGPALFSAALFVFAFGVRGAGSVTARRPVGTIALALLALWLLLGSVSYGLIGDDFSNAPTLFMAFAYADSFVQFALAVIAVMQIARLGAVPAPWNWLPAGIVAAVTVTWLLLQLLGGGSPTIYGPNLLTWLLTGLDGLARIGGTVLLGLIAIVLADRVNRKATANVSLVPETQI
ncbi:hypothetical protein SAMN05216368_12110 [Cryobacterium flavum]|uniref:Uncharacterized protein n=1 Tax=Cryobacterium flavum TaxID=1424659 RepID=A0A4R8V938_9MICO|nr:hypothetical protein [Cryobacterium flavum]TFB78111.1 hypothetical protein E3O21_06635 [Cryobacterium flavum]SDO51701.1 hypothetical protein SAMN05216368_12110 [Cryobacterium flavum]